MGWHLGCTGVRNCYHDPRLSNLKDRDGDSKLLHGLSVGVVYCQEYNPPSQRAGPIPPISYTMGWHLNNPRLGWDRDITRAESLQDVNEGE
jgi:hypothetical protein